MRNLSTSDAMKLAGNLSPVDRERVMAQLRGKAEVPTRRKKRGTGEFSERKRRQLAAVVAVRGGNTCLIPIRTVSEANVREHYMTKARRAKAQREAVDLFVRRLDLPPLPAVVRLERIGRKLLDAHDNLPRSLKACADQVACIYGVADNDQRIAFEYGQEVGKEYGVRVVLQAKGLNR